MPSGLVSSTINPSACIRRSVVERAVRERTERTQQSGEPFAQLVAVHRRFEQEAENCQFEQNRLLVSRTHVERVIGPITVSHQIDAVSKCIAPIYRTASRVAEITDLRSAHRPREYSLTHGGPQSRHPAWDEAAPRQVVDYALRRRARLAEVNSGRVGIGEGLRRQSVPAQGPRHSTAHRRTSRARSAARKRSRWCRGCSAIAWAGLGSARSAAEIELLAHKHAGVFRARRRGLPDLPLEPFGALHVSGLKSSPSRTRKWRSDPRADRIPS